MNFKKLLNYVCLREFETCDWI